jgi:hypothetical protein
MRQPSCLLQRFLQHNLAAVLGTAPGRRGTQFPGRRPRPAFGDLSEDSDHVIVARAIDCAGLQGNRADFASAESRSSGHTAEERLAYRRLLSDCRESHRNLLLSGGARSSRLLNQAGLAREQKEVNQIHRHLISKATRGALRRPGPRIAVEAHVGGVCGFVTRSAPSVRSCRGTSGVRG